MLLYQVISNNLLVRSRKLIGGFSRAKMVLSYKVANFGKIAPGRPQPNFEPLAVFQWFGRLESTNFFDPINLHLRNVSCGHRRRLPGSKN